MTTGPTHADELGRLGFIKGRSAPTNLFAMVGLFAALTCGATAHAQSAQPEARAQGAPPPPAAAPSQDAPPAEAPNTAVTSTPATTTAPVPTPGTMTPVPDAPGAEGETSVHAPGAEGEGCALPPQERREISAKLGQIDTRYQHLDQERSERSRITGPITMMSAGYATATAALAGAAISFVGARRVEDADGDYENRLDFNNDDVVDGDDERAFRRFARTAGVISAVGFGFGIAGTVMLAKRMKERREYEPELRRMKHERDRLRRQLDYGANASSQGLTLSVSGRF